MKEIGRERNCKGYATAWKRNNANMREFMGRKDDLRKEKRARKREKIQKILKMMKQKMKMRKLGRMREELKNRKGEDEDGFGKWRDVILVRMEEIRRKIGCDDERES